MGPSPHDLSLPKAATAVAAEGRSGEVRSSPWALPSGAAPACSQGQGEGEGDSTSPWQFQPAPGSPTTPGDKLAEGTLESQASPRTHMKTVWPPDRGYLGSDIQQHQCGARQQRRESPDVHQSWHTIPGWWTSAATLPHLSDKHHDAER